MFSSYNVSLEYSLFEHFMVVQHLASSEVSPFSPISKKILHIGPVMFGIHSFGHSPTLGIAPLIY